MSNDQLLTDICLIQYINDDGNFDYISPKNALAFYQLMTDKVHESIDMSLKKIAEKWLNEISVIEEALREKKKIKF